MRSNKELSKYLVYLNDRSVVMPILLEHGLLDIGSRIVKEGVAVAPFKTDNHYALAACEKHLDGTTMHVILGMPVSQGEEGAEFMAGLLAFMATNQSGIKGKDGAPLSGRIEISDLPKNEN